MGTGECYAIAVVTGKLDTSLPNGRVAEKVPNDAGTKFEANAAAAYPRTRPGEPRILNLHQTPVPNNYIPR